MLKIDNEFIELNEKLVYSIINEYSNKETIDDLYQVGMMAVMKAAKNFDESKGVKFSSYAYYYIKGEVLKYIRENRCMRLSKDMVKNYIKIIKAKEYIYKTYGRNVTSEELSKLTNIDEIKINEIVSACSIIESLDSTINEEDDYTLLDTIKSNEKVSSIDLILLKDAISSLDKEEQQFIYERYYNNKSQTEIAKEKNTTQVKVYRYERSLLDKMKEKVA